jgi:hypothetical protein
MGWFCKAGGQSYQKIGARFSQLVIGNLWMSDFGCRSGAGAAQRHDAVSERGGRPVFESHWRLKD